MISIGSKVIMNDNYYVSKNNKEKIFNVISKSWFMCGSEVVKLDGYSGCYALDGLDEVENNEEMK